MEEGFVICYESRKLKEHENNYATHYLEIESMVDALNMWRHYFLERKLELIKDHMNLKHLLDQSSLNSRQAGWIESLSDFDFEIKHVK